MSAAMTSFVRDPIKWILLGAVIVALTVAFAFARELRQDSDDTSVSSAPSSSLTPDAGNRLIAETNGVIAFWEKRLETDPYDFIAANTLADLYLRRMQQTGDVGDIGRAEAVLLVSLELMPSSNYEGEVLLAHVYNSKHEFSRALGVAQPLVAAYPNEELGWGALGDAQLALGRYEEAEFSYGRMVALAPGPASFGRMAHIAEILGDPERARLNWQSALDGGGDAESTAWAAAEFGHLELSYGQFAAAEQHFDASLASFPGNTRALSGLARVAAVRGNDAEAVALYEHVVTRSPHPVDVIALGDLHARAGREDDANRQYELVRAIGQLYEANAVRFDLAMILFEADHGNDASATLDRARMAYAERPSIYAADALSWALFRAGRLDEARMKAEEALRFGTLDASFLFHAGMIAGAQNDDTAARTFLERALSLNPEFHPLQAEEARAVLERLAGR